jgi:hypothetical protein
MDINFTYDDNDIISDTIINFYNSCDCKTEIADVIKLYVSDKKFFDYIQKNFLVKKISVSYLLRLYNDYDSDNIVDEYDYITSVSTTRWI